MSTATLPVASEAALSLHESIKTPAMQFRVHLGGATPPEKVIATLYEACQSLSVAERYSGKLRLLVGRLLLITAERKLYKPEFSKLEDFLTNLTEKYGIARSTLFEGYRIAKRLPFITPEKYESLGPNVLMEATRLMDAHGPKVKKAIEASDSAVDLQEALRPLSKGPGVGYIGIGLKVSAETEREWQAVQKLYAAQAGSDSPSEIFAFIVHSILEGQRAAAVPAVRRRTKTA